MKTLTQIALFLWMAGAQAADQGVDAHIHIVSKRAAEASGFGQEYLAKDALSQLDKAGLKNGVLISAAFSLPIPAQAESENDFLITQIAEHGKRFVGLCGINLTFDIDWIFKEIDRCASFPSVRGLKIHPQTNGIDLRNAIHRDTIAKIFARAGERNLVVLVDSMWFDARVTFEMSKIAVMNPKTKIIFGHALFSDFADLIVPAMFYEGSSTQNLYVDLSATLNMYADSPEVQRLVWYLRKFGIHRVILGSDFPAFTPSSALEALNKLPLEPAEIEAIRAKNSNELFKFE